MTTLEDNVAALVKAMAATNLKVDALLQSNIENNLTSEVLAGGGAPSSTAAAKTTALRAHAQGVGLVNLGSATPQWEAAQQSVEKARASILKSPELAALNENDQIMKALRTSIVGTQQMDINKQLADTAAVLAMRQNGGVLGALMNIPGLSPTGGVSRAIASSYEGLRTGQMIDTIVGGAVTNLMGSKAADVIGTAKGIGKTAQFVGNRVNNFQQSAANTRGFGAATGQGLAPYNQGFFGGIGDVPSNAFPLLSYAGIAAGLGVPFASQAQTAGVMANYQAFKRVAMNPSGGLSLSKSQAIQQGAALRGYSGQTLSTMQTAASDVVGKNNNFTPDQTLAFMDQAVRRFNVNANQAATALLQMGTASKDAMKSLQDFYTNTMTINDTNASQGVSNYSQSNQAANIMQTVPNMTGTDVQNFFQNLSGITSAQLLTQPGQNKTLIGLGNTTATSSGGYNYSAISTGVNVLNQMMKTQMAANGGQSATVASNIVAMELSAQGQTTTPQQVLAMYQSGPSLIKQANNATTSATLQAQLKKSSDKNFTLATGPTLSNVNKAIANKGSNIKGSPSGGGWLDSVSSTLNSVDTTLNSITGHSGGSLNHGQLMNFQNTLGISVASLGESAGTNLSSTDVDKILNAVMTGTSLKSGDPDQAFVDQINNARKNDKTYQALLSSNGLSSYKNKSYADTWKTMGAADQKTALKWLSSSTSGLSAINQSQDLAALKTGGASIASLTSTINSQYSALNAAANSIGTVTITLSTQAAKALGLSSTPAGTNPSPSAASNRNSTVQVPVTVPITSGNNAGPGGG